MLNAKLAILLKRHQAMLHDDGRVDRFGSGFERCQGSRAFRADAPADLDDHLPVDRFACDLGVSKVTVKGSERLPEHRIITRDLILKRKSLPVVQQDNGSHSVITL